ncbi:MAG: AMP-dependent synthetase, partial [Candidatus Zixiibacteriota bacterium]
MADAADVQDNKQDNIFTAILESAKRNPDRVALKGEGGRGRQYTYRELLTAITALAAGLSAPRFADIAEVGLLAENRPEWPIAYLGILGAGKTVVPFDANLAPGELKNLIRLSGVRLLLLSARFASLLEYLPDSLTVYCLDGSYPENWQLLFVPAPDAASPRPPADPAALIYTSGTTGAPKAAMLSHRNILSNSASATAALELFADDVFLSVLPLHHTLEATCGFLTPLLVGATIVYARSLKSRQLIEDIRDNGVTVMIGVPLLFEKMHDGILRAVRQAAWPRRAVFDFTTRLASFGLDRGKAWGKPLFASLRRKAGLGSIRLFVCGGAPLPPEIARFFTLIGITFLQ